MKSNVFIVVAPLHIMNAIEAVEYFNTSNNILVVLHIGNEKQLAQMNKMLNLYDWDEVHYIQLPLKTVDKLVYAKNIYKALETIDRSSIEKIFVGEYRSDHVNHIVNTFKSNNIYLLDDGLAQLNYHKEMHSTSLKVKVRRVLYTLFLYKLKPLKYTFFTIFDIKDEKIIKNNYNYFKKYIGKKKIEDSVYFIGQPLVELSVMSQENHKKELAKIIEFYKEKTFIYIVHRREEIKNIQQLSLELDFSYKEFDNLIELEMINSKVVPSHFATFYSTAIVTLPSFISDSDYRVFRTKEEIIDKKFINNITRTYTELEKMGLRVESL
jgi:hypothetical protein